MPVARTMKQSVIGTISSHCTVGLIPLASANMMTTIRVHDRG